MLVVSDASALTSLIQVNRVEVLARLYGEICIPEAVQKELLRTHSVLPEFVRVRPTESKAELQRLCAELDLGEAEAIVLAKEINADYLLVDKTLDRQVAIREGLRVIGLLGVLLEGKRPRVHILDTRSDF